MRGSPVDRSPGVCWYDEAPPPAQAGSRIRRHLWWASGAVLLMVLFEAVTQPAAPAPEPPRRQSGRAPPEPPVEFTTTWRDLPLSPRPQPVIPEDADLLIGEWRIDVG